MTGNAALTEEMTRLLDEHPREARENRFSASLCGEMAVMRLLHNGTKKKMTAGELSSRLSMTTSRVAAVLGSLEKKGLLERENDAVDRRRVLVSPDAGGRGALRKAKSAFKEQNRAAAVHAATTRPNLCGCSGGCLKSRRPMRSGSAGASKKIRRDSMAETKPTGAKKHITGARIAQEIKQYKKGRADFAAVYRLLRHSRNSDSVSHRVHHRQGHCCGNMAHVAKIGALMAVMAILAMFFRHSRGRAQRGRARGWRAICANPCSGGFRHIPSNIDKFSTAGLVTRLTTDVTNIQNAFQMILQICTRAPVTLIVALFMAFSINAKLSLVFLVAMAFLGVMIFVLIPRAMKYFKLMFRKYDVVNGVVQKNVGAIRVVKAFVREDYEDEKFSGAANALFKNPSPPSASSRFPCRSCSSPSTPAFCPSAGSARR